MAGIFDRISRVFGGKDDSSSADPRAALQDAYAEQTQVLQQVRRSAAEVAGSRKRLGEQTARLAAEIDSLTLSARRSLSQGQEQLATEALRRKHDLAQELAGLDQEHARLQLEEERLVLASSRLQAKLDAIRVKQETIWATYSAEEAKQRLVEALAGLASDSVAAAQSSVAAVTTDPAETAAQAAAELAAMKADLADRSSAGLDPVSYQQPNLSPADGSIQDARVFEPAETEQEEAR